MDERITLKWFFKKCDEGVDWFDLAQDKDKWAVVNEGNPLTDDLLASEEGLCSMELVITNVKLVTSRYITDHNAVS
jgi:hypothetical protein